jgi:hypothetical protein
VAARSGASINRAEIVAYLVDHYRIDSRTNHESEAPLRFAS